VLLHLPNDTLAGFLFFELLLKHFSSCPQFTCHFLDGLVVPVGHLKVFLTPQIHHLSYLQPWNDWATLVLSFQPVHLYLALSDVSSQIRSIFINRINQLVQSVCSFFHLSLELRHVLLRKGSLCFRCLIRLVRGLLTLLLKRLERLGKGQAVRGSEVVTVRFLLGFILLF